jgi:hypothetical protein
MTALDDLEMGKVELVIKLFPVISWLIKDRPELEVAMDVPTHEKLGIAFALDNVELCDVINDALQTLEKTMANWQSCGRDGSRPESIT